MKLAKKGALNTIKVKAEKMESSLKKYDKKRIKMLERNSSNQIFYIKKKEQQNTKKALIWMKDKEK